MNGRGRGALVVVGAHGLVGAQVARVARLAGYDVSTLIREDLNLTAPGGDAVARAARTVTRLVDARAARAVVMAAAVSSVEACERDPDATWRVNVALPGELARILAGVRVVAFSSEYVFDGRKDTTYVEDDARAPLNVYGRQKVELEDLLAGAGHTVLRTSGVYDVESQRKNFVYQMLAATPARRLRVAGDQLVTPTLARDLAAFVLLVIERGIDGIVHAAGPDVLSRPAFAQEVQRAFDLGDVIDVVPTSAMGLRAPRPMAGLDTSRASALAPGLFQHPADGLAVMRSEVAA